MVFIAPSFDIPRLNAYLLTDLSDDELSSFKKTFELGTYAPFNPILELVIKKAPEDYLGKPHSYMRTKEDSAGRVDSFVLIDERAVQEGAVWYVDRFADEDEVDEEQAESTSVLWQILVKTECLPLAYVNYSIGNMSIQEDLDSCGVDFPAKECFEQSEVYDCGGLDVAAERHTQNAWATAEPGEFEVSTDEALRKNFAPMPDRVGRLKEDIAKQAGLRSDWTFCGGAGPRDLPDGTKKEFPEGSVTLQLYYDPDFPWPPYKWPEGSL
ncbi:hypothetical protein F4804DRAFT_277057 [Jackrogersella minutella]|nr:hypothetical protein F4804DRAFT_277057 [Jackrogersella minutella]